MAKRWKIIAACLPAILLVLTQSAFTADVTLDVSVNRTGIYLGESALLSVKVSGLDKPQTMPDLSAIKNCSIKLLGSHSDSSFSIVIVNGKISRSGSTGRIYSYEITPSAMGTIETGPVTLAVDGKMITGAGPSIQVTGVEKQDRVIISIKASRDSVIVSEPFDVTLSIMLKRLPGQFADIEPIDPGDPPTLSVPFLETSAIPGLEMPDIEKIIKEHLVQRADAPGFAINNYTLQSDPFDLNSMFNFGGRQQQRKAKFTFEKVIIDRDGNSYFEYNLKLSYTPKEEGSHTFGPAIFKGPVIIEVDQANRGIRNAVFAVGPAAAVRVIPPPEEDRPSSYIGAIGSNINVEAEIDAQTCKVGDPLKLTLGISGNINIENINPPPLNMQANLTKSFKIYEDTIQTSTKDGKKTFTFTIRPTTAGTIELPPIEVSYFDSASRAYKTVRTLPIPVRANESVEIGAANIIETATNRPTEAGKASQRDAIVIAPVDMNPAGDKPASVALTNKEIATLLAGPLLYILIIAGRFARKHLKLDEGPRRRRQAVDEAISTLHHFNRSQKADRPGSSNTLCTAIRKYIANRFNAPEAGMTPSDARRLLEENGIEPVTANDLCDILERNFNSAYSSSSTDPANVIKDCGMAIKHIDRIENNLRASPGEIQDRQGFAKPTFLLLVCTLATACLSITSAIADNPVEFKFLWDEANSRMASASSKEDFIMAATVYQKLADEGVCNGTVFYNMGTALLMARQYDRAEKAFLRAERYSGSNDDIRHNLLLAVKGKEANPNASLPWYRVPLFWHYQLSMSTRKTIAVIAFAGIWLALSLRALGSRNIYKPILSVSIIIVIVIGSSVATSLQQEDKDLRSSSRIIINHADSSQTGERQTTNSPALIQKRGAP